MKHSQSFAALALAIAGILFLLFPFVRPWGDETTADGAAAVMSSAAWVAAHLCHMFGLMLVALGVLGVRDIVGGKLAYAAVVTMWVGATLIVGFLGVETFGVHVIAAQYANGVHFDLLALIKALRFTPAAITIFAVGMFAVTIGGVLTALAIRRSTVLPRSSGVLFAVSFVLFIPQFATPPEVRTGYGVLLAAGCIWLAAALWRARPVSTTA